MVQANYDYIDSLTGILVTLAKYISPKQFENKDPHEYFSEVISSRFRWHRTINEPHGPGTGGTIVNVPHLALDGGGDGLDCIRYLIETAPIYLRSGGIWLIEMMAGQGESVVELLRLNGNYAQIQLFSDLAGINRFALARRI